MPSRRFTRGLSAGETSTASRRRSFCFFVLFRIMCDVFAWYRLIFPVRGHFEAFLRAGMCLNLRHSLSLFRRGRKSTAFIEMCLFFTFFSRLLVRSGLHVLWFWYQCLSRQPVLACLLVDLDQFHLQCVAFRKDVFDLVYP